MIKKHAISKNFYKIIGDGLSPILIYRKDSNKKYNLNDLSTKILVYEDRVKGWFLDIGKELKKNNEAGFVILMICASYIEGVVQFKLGKSSKGQSAKVFVDYVKSLFKVHETVARAIYEDMRCGLFHDGMSRRRIAISGELKYPVMIDINRKTIGINPHLFLQKLNKDFNDYIKNLKNKRNKKLRSNFSKITNSNL
ncbi:hypothetical protein HYV49_00820 [Candidatus Pacearchaeota archaeon]|nr:hypothetical protein [Candidatus Pacearchaeota archaeon]